MIPITAFLFFAFTVAGLAVGYFNFVLMLSDSPAKYRSEPCARVVWDAKSLTPA